MTSVHQAGDILQGAAFEVRQGDALEVLRGLEAESVDAIVTDPPYGLKFMGKTWDHGVPGELFWIETRRVAKPGAHLVAFGGTRTYHRLACAIEDAGWEIRDCLMWLYGSGFPKSMDVSKAIDKAAGAKRPVLATEKRSDKRGGNYHGASERRPPMDWDRTGPATAAAAAAALQGLGTALKPAWESIILARKPLIGSVAANVLEHGTGALAIDPCRIETAEEWDDGGPTKPREDGIGYASSSSSSHPAGRWPANVLLDEDAAPLLDEQAGVRESRESGPRLLRKGASGADVAGNVSAALGAESRPAGAVCGIDRGDAGGVSRFFYTAKASSGERHYAFDRAPLVIYTEPSWANAVLGPRLLAGTGLSVQKATEGSTILGNDGSAWSMCWCGSLSTDPYHPAIKSIIETKTSSTTAPKTWKRSARPHTNGCMAAVFGAMAHGGSPASCAGSSSPWEQLIGTSAERDGRSTDGADLATSVALWLKSESAKPGRGGGHRVRDGNSHPT